MSAPTGFPRALLRDTPRFHFVFVGSGAEWGALREAAQARGLENTEFLRGQPKEKMPEIYAAADTCLVPLKKRDIFRYNIPSKMFEIMACARPIILGATGQALQLLEEADGGIAVEPENAEAYRDAILRLAEDPNLAERFGQQGRAHVVAHYTRNSKADAFLECLATTLDLETDTTDLRTD